jgi:hypothetical protein
MFKQNGKVYLEDHDKFLRHCCICRHFRMFKPSPEWCTRKKTKVPPFGIEKCFKLRKGMSVFNLATGGTNELIPR